MPWVEAGNPRGPPRGSLNHEGDGGGSVLRQPAALRRVWLLPQRRGNSLCVVLIKGSFHLQRITSCWEEWDKRQQMNQEILMRYNSSPKVSTGTCVCLANFRAKLQLQTSLVGAFFHPNVALSPHLFCSLALMEILSHSECLVEKKMHQSICCFKADIVSPAFEI